MLSIAMLCFHFYAECHYAKCLYAECRGTIDSCFDQGILKGEVSLYC
jgi:hypothetical protein